MGNEKNGRDRPKQSKEIPILKLFQVAHHEYLPKYSPTCKGGRKLSKRKAQYHINKHMTQKENPPPPKLLIPINKHILKCLSSSHQNHSTTLSFIKISSILLWVLFYLLTLNCLTTFLLCSGTFGFRIHKFKIK